MKFFAVYEIESDKLQSLLDATNGTAKLITVVPQQQLTGGLSSIVVSPSDETQPTNLPGLAHDLTKTVREQVLEFVQANPTHKFAVADLKQRFSSISAKTLSTTVYNLLAKKKLKKVKPGIFTAV